jgi:RIO kinase 1
LGQNKTNEDTQALDDLIGQGLVAGVLGRVKSGKEATVYCCEAEPETGVPLLAAKVYRQRDVRRFANDAAYNAGRLRQRQRRETRAILNKSEFGREQSFGRWVADEYETLSLLHRGGCAVPRPFLRSDRIIIMEYIGDDDAPAPVLAAVRLDPSEARHAFEALLRNVELALACDRIHGDLSAYNVLWHDGELHVIDFPQAVDARFNPNALELLERDLANVCGFFARYGIEADAGRIARRMWSRYIRSEL